MFMYVILMSLCLITVRLTTVVEKEIILSIVHCAKKFFNVTGEEDNISFVFIK